jgi:hypothetical protein
MFKNPVNGGESWNRRVFIFVINHKKVLAPLEEIVSCSKNIICEFNLPMTDRL